MKPILTIFTPTYNRAYILEKAYKSLQYQSDKRFEWIIVDDGSNDNTKSLVQKWQAENNIFEIKYYFQKNSGKHIAINNGIEFAKGRVFLILDSDDYLRNDAVEIIIKYVDTINIKMHYGGVVGNRAYFDGEIIGSTFDGKYKDLTFFEREKNGITGDKAEVFFTDILRQYKFPKFANEKFCTEALVWNRIAKDGWVFRFFNENIYYTEYLDDGLTKKYWKLMYHNPKQAYVYYKELLKSNLYISIKRKIKIKIMSTIFGYLSGIQVQKLKQELNINTLEFCIFIIIGLIHKKRC